MNEKLIVKDSVYVPKSLLESVDKVKRAYTKRIYEDNVCQKCEFLDDRHSFHCDGCPAYKGKISLYKDKRKKGISYLCLPVGDKNNFEKKTGLFLEDLDIVDRRVKSSFDYKIKFIAKLRPEQERLQTEFLRKKYGVIEAPPRFGKTITALSIALKLKQRFVVLAHQHEFLTQFADHIRGNEKESIPKCTNLPELEHKYKKKLYGIPKTEEDYENFQIFLMTYQSFHSKKGQIRFKNVMKNVGTLVVDECHKGNANEFAKVVSNAPPRYKFGVTATVERKDKKHFIIKSLLGPIVARSKVEALTPTVYVHETEAVPPAGRYQSGRPSDWVFAMQFLARHKKRNEQIVRMVMKDLKAGHNIVIPITFKKHAFELKAAINKAYGSNICETFLGGGGNKNKEQRKEILSKAKKGQIRVVVGMRQLLQLGLNVPSWSAIYTAMPINNRPNYKQETSRIRTPKKGKKIPIIRIFVDRQLGQSLGCARNCINQCVEFKYRLSDKESQKELVREILSYPRKRRSYDEDEYDAEFIERFSVKPIRKERLPLGKI